MPSPFPGMNPYLEQEDAWHDFHQSYVPELRTVLAEAVGPRYIVKIDDHVYVHEMPEGERRLVGRPDVYVAERGGPGEAAARENVAVVEAPAHATLLDVIDEEHVSYLEVRDRESRELVSVIEVLSPSNKNWGSDRHQYLAKRREMLSAGVNFVEIDLLRGGLRTPLTGAPECDYRVLVLQPAELPRVGVWPIDLHEPLPAVPVPLRAPDPPVRLDLQGALHRVYDDARYAKFVYDGSPQPALTDEDAKWAADILAGT